MKRGIFQTFVHDVMLTGRSAVPHEVIVLRMNRADVVEMKQQIVQELQCFVIVLVVNEGDSSFTSVNQSDTNTEEERGSRVTLNARKQKKKTDQTSKRHRFF